MTKPQINRIVALLPMKANSSRVKGKNFRDFCGKPLFRWTLDTLLEVDEIDQIIINTDARHILAEFGLIEHDRILIRDRRPEIRGDNVSMNLVLADDIANVPADLYLMTHTTNPLITTDTIQRCIASFQALQSRGVADSLFTVNEVRSRFYRSDRSPVNHDPEDLIPTQELEPWYEENSNLYIFTAKSFLENNARIGSNPVMHSTSSIESIDIDTPEDWELALAVARHISGSISLSNLAESTREF